MIARNGWALKSASSEEPDSYNFARFAFDGAVNSYWHTRWITNTPAYPHEIQIDLGASRALTSFSYLPRHDNGIARIKAFEFFVSEDGINWGTPAVASSFAPGLAESRFNFGTRTARFIRLRALNSFGGESVAAVAEINVFAPPGPVASQLSYSASGDSPALKAAEAYQLYLVICTGKRTYLPVTSK